MLAEKKTAWEFAKPIIDELITGQITEED